MFLYLHGLCFYDTSLGTSEDKDADCTVYMYFPIYPTASEVE